MDLVDRSGSRDGGSRIHCTRCGREVGMSRLYDRIRARGTVPLTVSDLIFRALGLNPRAMVAEVANAEGLAVTPAVVDAVAAQGMANLAKIRAPERPLHPRELPEMPVVDAGNVARYVAELRHKV